MFLPLTDKFDRIALVQLSIIPSIPTVSIKIKPAVKWMTVGLMG